MSSVHEDDLEIATRRLHDQANAARVDHGGSWVLVDLGTGALTGEFFDTRPAAVRAARNAPRRYMTLILRAEGISPRACRNMLRFHRDMVSVGCDVLEETVEYRPGAHAVGLRSGEPRLWTP